MQSTIISKTSIIVKKINLLLVHMVPSLNPLKGILAYNRVEPSARNLFGFANGSNAGTHFYT